MLVCDEYRMIPQEVIQKVLKKFGTAPRDAGYLHKPEYKHLVERNKEIYLTSAWMKTHWSWDHVKGFAANMVDDTKKYFICSMPYQLSIEEGLLLRDTVIDEMSEETFSKPVWDMEMSGIFMGENENSFFNYEQLMVTRKIEDAIYPQDVYKTLGKLVKYPHKENGEIRIITADIAVMSSKKNKNDATAVFVIRLKPNKNGQYIRDVVYSETMEGGHTETQAIFIRRLYEQMECDYIVLDTNGAGIGIYDCLVSDLYDRDIGIEYPAVSCMNDDEMASRYKGSMPFPNKVIYSVKANANFNSECAFSLKDCLVRGKMRLLLSETDFEEKFANNKQYIDLEVSDRMTLKFPYIQTSLLINELINLECTTNGSEVKLKEQGNARKDRYSSLSYGNYFANQLERKLRKPKDDIKVMDFMMRSPQLRKMY